LLLGNSLQVLPDGTAFTPNNESLELPTNPDTNVFWTAFLNVYGKVRPGISQIWLQNPYMETEIVGTIAFNPNDDRLLIYNIDPDTLPQNTLAAVDSVVDPTAKSPGNNLPLPANGQRYLIVESIDSTYSYDPTSAWGTLKANANDIIEYDSMSGAWFVSFDSNNLTDTQYVTNLTSGVQYRYTDTWMKSWEGWYEAGDFSVVI
jgi:hypothetical protein